MSAETSNQKATMNESSGRAPKVMIVAGEASGDLHGALLVREMLAVNPSLEFFGIGGNRMQEAGVKLLAHAADIAVVGVSEVFSKTAVLLRTISRMKESMDRLKPNLAILIDFPDFNLNIAARAARKRGIRVFYYISPQVWAWREGRVEQIKKLVNEMAVILPFEVDFYAKRGFDVHWVGHPLLDIVKTPFTAQEARAHFGLSESKTTIGLLPGSRTSEISKLLPEMIQGAQIISRKIPETQYILPLADTLEEKTVAGFLQGSGLNIQIVAGRTYDVLACCDLAIVTSGTATLETGLMGVPMIIVYKVSLFSELIGRMIIRQQHIGLVNILAGKTVAPELIQRDAGGPRIAFEALAILQNREKRQQIIRDLGDIRAKLGKPGAAGRAAQIACNML
jgi:lipid-A-disaccharide synthase